MKYPSRGSGRSLWLASSELDYIQIYSVDRLEDSRKEEPESCCVDSDAAQADCGCPVEACGYARRPGIIFVGIIELRTSYFIALSLFMQQS